jgi:hypothetical protein
MGSELQTYFVQVRSMNDCEAADGLVVGHLLMDAALAASSDERSQAVSQFVMRTAMLRDCECCHLDVLLSAIVENKYRTTKKGETRDPALLTAKEAAAIGRSFALILLQSNGSSAAVQEYLDGNPAIGELVRKYRWFRPMTEALAKRLLAVTPFGMKLRVLLGAAISIGTPLSTCKVAIELWDTPRYTVAYATLALLATSLLMQTVLIVVQVCMCLIFDSIGRFLGIARATLQLAHMRVV